MTTTALRRTAAAAVAAALALGAGACTSDDETSSTATTAGATEDGATTTAGDTAACDAYTAIPEAFGDEGPPPDPAAAAAVLADLTAALPADVTEQFASLLAALQAGLDGDAEAVGEEEFNQYSELGAALVDVCPADSVLEVTAIDYGFEGLQSTMPAGRANIRFVNASAGGEDHELVVVRRKDGVDTPFSELLQIEDEEELLTQVDDIGFTFAPPDGQGAAFLDLVPGDYIAVCFIPQGGTDDGAPHVTLGMQAEFTVE